MMLPIDPILLAYAVEEGLLPESDFCLECDVEKPCECELGVQPSDQ